MSLTCRSTTRDFLLTFRFIVTIGLSRTAFEIKIFSPRVFYVPAEGVPLGIGHRFGATGQKTRAMGLLGRERSFTTSLAI